MAYVYARQNKLPLGSLIAWANQKIDGLKQGILNEYDIDRSWLVLYQIYNDNVLPSPPYQTADDNKVFEVMKENKLSFIDFSHDDLNKGQIYAEMIFGKIKIPF